MLKTLLITIIILNFSTSIIFGQNSIIKGKATWYGPQFNGKPTASGEIYNMYKLTAAHKTLPFGTIVKVTNLKNDKSVVVRINDRGPFVGNRIIDLSYAAAKAIDLDGVEMVSLEILNSENSSNSNNYSDPDMDSIIEQQNNSYEDIPRFLDKDEVQILPKDCTIQEQLEYYDKQSKEKKKPYKDTIKSKNILYLNGRAWVKFDKSDYYFIQLSSFKDGKNAVAMAQLLKESKIKTLVLYISEDPVQYKVIFNYFFNNLNDAKSCLEKLKYKEINGFILKL